MAREDRSDIPILRLLLLFPALLLAACGTLPDNTARISSTRMTAIDSTLYKAVTANVAEHPGLSGFHLLPDGLDAFAARALLANRAERTIDAQYYLFHDDLTGNLLLERLLAAADRGVRVRLLIDDMDTAGRDQDFAALDAHPHFELRLFNPYASRSSRSLEMITRFGRVTRRMHNKSFTVDGVVTVVGGRNVGNEYFSAYPTVEFGDLDVLGAGPVATDVSAVFDAYWNHSLAYPAATLSRSKPSADQLENLRTRLQSIVAQSPSSAYAERLRDSPLVEQLENRQLALHWGRARVFADRPDKLLTSPDDRSTHMGPRLRADVQDATSEVLIFSPYFVPGDTGVDWLASLVERGVRVRILTNSLASNDVSVVHAGYSKYRKDLLRAGVGLFEAKAQSTKPKKDRDPHWGGSSRASLHAKTFAFDRQRLFVGSLNLDPRSAVLNTEMGIVFDNAQLAGNVGDWFDARLRDVAYELKLDDQDNIEWVEHRADGDRIYQTEPNTGFFKRMSVWFARLLPIEGQL